MFWWQRAAFCSRLIERWPWFSKDMFCWQKLRCHLVKCWDVETWSSSKHFSLILKGIDLLCRISRLFILQHSRLFVSDQCDLHFFIKKIKMGCWKGRGEIKRQKKKTEPKRGKTSNKISELIEDKSTDSHSYVVKKHNYNHFLSLETSSIDLIDTVPPTRWAWDHSLAPQWKYTGQNPGKSLAWTQEIADIPQGFYFLSSSAMHVQRGQHSAV